jgi:hypothetical protein
MGAFLPDFVISECLKGDAAQDLVGPYTSTDNTDDLSPTTFPMGVMVCYRSVFSASVGGGFFSGTSPIAQLCDA